MSTDIDRRIAFLTAALEQANETIRSKMDELSLVRRAGDAISHHTSIWSLSSELVDAIAETVNCKYALIYTASDAGQFELQAVSSTFSSPEEFPVTIGPSGLEALAVDGFVQKPFEVVKLASTVRDLLDEVAVS